MLQVGLRHWVGWLRLNFELFCHHLRIPSHGNVHNGLRSVLSLHLMVRLLLHEVKLDLLLVNVLATLKILSGIHLLVISIGRLLLPLLLKIVGSLLLAKKGGVWLAGMVVGLILHPLWILIWIIAR